MPEVGRCNTIEVGEPVLRAGSKIEACDQVEQTLKDAIRAFDRQRFLIKRRGPSPKIGVTIVELAFDSFLSDKKAR